MSKQLHQAYLQTIYRIFEPPIDIKIGQKHPELDAFLSNKQVKSWAFVTAWNPRSAELGESENVQRNERLVRQLRARGFSFYEGAGIPADDSWQPEASFLIVGINQKEAIQLGHDFEQNAIVYGEIGNKADLVGCVK